MLIFSSIEFLHGCKSFLAEGKYRVLITDLSNIDTGCDWGSFGKGAFLKLVWALGKGFLGRYNSFQTICLIEHACGNVGRLSLRQSGPLVL